VASITCELGEGPVLAARAARWLAGFHPDIGVVVADRKVVLAAERWSEAELQAAWRSALANERLLDGAAEHRASVLRALVA